MVDKIKITYPILVGYFAFVLVSSLLLGLLLPFVNRPTCDPKTSKYDNDVNQIVANQQKTRLALPQRIENFKRNYTGKYATNNPYLKDNLKILEELPPICEEILNFLILQNLIRGKIYVCQKTLSQSITMWKCSFLLGACQSTMAL